mmetsp:Transcript_27158/g.68289  ORF Transcript_27158/g.68289 Transcript_27158/m.68289 type:complete len:250 (-) Transcript_27158:1175-1924(-)
MRRLLPIGAKAPCVLHADCILHEVLNAHPELAVICEHLPNCLDHLICPLSIVVVIGPQPLPLPCAPWIPATYELVTMRVHELEHAIRMPRNQAIIGHSFATLATRGGTSTGPETSGQQPPLIPCLLQNFEISGRIALVRLFDRKSPANTPEKGVDCFPGLAAIAHLIACMQLAESLLNQRNPNLFWLLASAIHELAVTIDWKVIVNQNIRPLAINIEKQAIHSYVNVILNEHPLHLLVALASDCTQGSK